MSSAYIIANVQVTDPVQYEHYKHLSSLAMQAHGAEVCVRGGESEVLEGPWTPGRLVLLRFPDRDQAKAFYHSQTYTHARSLREGAGIMRMVVVDGVPGS